MMTNVSRTNLENESGQLESGCAEQACSRKFEKCRDLVNLVTRLEFVQSGIFFFTLCFLTNSVVEDAGDEELPISAAQSGRRPAAWTGSAFVRPKKRGGAHAVLACATPGVRSSSVSRALSFWCV